MKKYFVLLIAIIFVACQTPYSGTLGPKDFNGWIESETDEMVCLWNGFDQLCYITITEIVEQVVERIVVQTEYVEVEKIVEIVKERIVEVRVDVPVEIIVTRTIEVIKEIYVTESVSEPTSPEPSPPAPQPERNDVDSEPVIGIRDVSVDVIVNEIESNANPIPDVIIVKDPPPQKDANPSPEEAAALIEEHWINHEHQPHAGAMVKDSEHLDYSDIENILDDTTRIKHAHEKGTDADGFYIGYIIKDGKIRHVRSRDRNETPKLVQRLVVHSHSKPNWEGLYR
jgi:hypothetical protein